MSFGARYYLRRGNIDPFLQAGLNHEINFIGKYHYTIDKVKYVEHHFGSGYNIFRLTANLGIGLSIKLNSKFILEAKYDLYRNIIKSNDDFIGYSILSGLKYNL